MQRFLPFLIVAAVAALTLMGGTLLYRANQRPLLTISKDQAAAGSALHLRGRAEAPVRLEEWGDFECPPCGLLAGAIGQLEKDYADRLCVVFHQFPLKNHAHAQDAARASEAAGLQGRFWDMHDLLYRDQYIWSVSPAARRLFDSYAKMLRLDVDRFQRDMDSEQIKTLVAADQQRGATLGVTSTPTIFINNRQVRASAMTASGLRAAIERVLKTK